MMTAIRTVSRGTAQGSQTWRWRFVYTTDKSVALPATIAVEYVLHATRCGLPRRDKLPKHHPGLCSYKDRPGYLESMNCHG